MVSALALTEVLAAIWGKVARSELDDELAATRRAPRAWPSSPSPESLADGVIPDRIRFDPVVRPSG